MIDVADNFKAQCEKTLKQFWVTRGIKFEANRRM
jgi:hypothetical protein